MSWPKFYAKYAEPLLKSAEVSADTTSAAKPASQTEPVTEIDQTLTEPPSSVRPRSKS